METVLALLLVLQFAIIVSHDWLDVPGWTHGRQVQEVVGRRKLAIATAINAIFPGLAVVFAIVYLNAPKPWFASGYIVAYCAITVLSAIAMWYVPYFFGTDAKTRQEYTRMYEGTRQVLPARGDNPRPNLLHICFHVLFVANLAIVLWLRFGR